MAYTLLEPHGHRNKEIGERSPDGSSHCESQRRQSPIPFAQASIAQMHHIGHGDHNKPEKRSSIAGVSVSKPSLDKGQRTKARILELDLGRMNLYYRAKIHLRSHGGLRPEDTEEVSSWTFRLLEMKAGNSVMGSKSELLSTNTTHLEWASPKSRKPRPYYSGRIRRTHYVG